MKVDLTSKTFFKDNEIQFDKKINFVFGKNGCGKSTITSLIKEQYASGCDVRIFDGFEGVVSENKRLETVILGEENTNIDKEIKEYEYTIRKIEKQIQEINENITKSEKQPENLWSQYNEKENKVKEQRGKIDNFCRKSAKTIKDDVRRISPTTYDINSFKLDIQNAKSLSTDEIQELNALLRSELKKAKKIEAPRYDLEKILSDVNSILSSKIEEAKIIHRLDTDSKKIFAEQGLKIHKAGDHCAFCNGIVKEDVWQELDTYFSVNKFKEIQDTIQRKIKYLEQVKSTYDNIKTNINEFYPLHAGKVKIVSNKINELKTDSLSFIDILILELTKKKDNLFSPSNKLSLVIPNNINYCIQEYNELVDKNNNNNLQEEQEEARKKLRYHAVKEHLDDFHYEVECNEFENRQKNFNKVKQDFEKEKDKRRKLQENIEVFKKKIAALQASTRNEKILVRKVNKKLASHASFELVHQEDSNEYKIKCLLTNQERNVNELSTGEKNILAFLYFIEKLAEADNKKCIIFDDPMNSNDDTFQYVIIETLQRLAKELNGENKLIILTHNAHFYLNVKYGFDNYSKSRFIRLIKLGHQVELKILENKDHDFKTNYQELWYELRFLFDKDDISSNMILNPIRRIIETYTKFNGFSLAEFYSDISGAKKLFDVNSHAIDDLEAELNGKTKEDILILMKECFKKNHSLKHFEQYWKH
ncbi:AAA family ATPase [Avibacterium gallinarum]|uniref:AAA family ATPase n=1 Tax=Avibacterium gallinarum TaxID=755 RepID=UPI0039FBF136